MITPGFFGLFNAYRGLLASQNAMSTINHNISNANTPGYSRQRVDLAAADAYALPTPSQLTAGQIGQGPVVQKITRSRDFFLDTQFRLANGKLGLNASGKDTLSQIEGVMNEPSTGSVNGTMQNFFDSAQELSLHPESTATRTNFTQQAMDLISIFQLQANQLADLRRNLVGDPLYPTSFSTSQLAVTVSDINSKLDSIATINRNIVSIKSSGAEPNDLYDQRDKLLDDLSQLVDISVNNYDNGQIDLSIGGETMIRGGKLVDTLESVENTGAAPTPDDVPSLVRTVNGGVVMNDGSGSEISEGRLKGILNLGGNDPSYSTVRGVLGRLDTLLGTIVDEVNTLQTAGRDQDGNLGTTNPLFVNNPALNPGQPLDLFHWQVNADVVNNPRLLSAAIDDATAAGGFAGVGDGRNAKSMGQLRDQTFATLGTGMVDYLNGLLSRLSVDSQTFQNASSIQQNLAQSTDLRRQSLSGVNMDEETIDLLRFQRAFEASSRTIRVLDDVMQTILNLVS